MSKQSQDRTECGRDDSGIEIIRGRASIPTGNDSDGSAKAADVSWWWPRKAEEGEAATSSQEKGKPSASKYEGDTHTSESDSYTYDETAAMGLTHRRGGAYKKELLVDEIDGNHRHLSSTYYSGSKTDVGTLKDNEHRRNAVLSTLQQLGVKVFVIDSSRSRSTAVILEHLKGLVNFVASEKRAVVRQQRRQQQLRQRAQKSASSNKSKSSSKSGSTSNGSHSVEEAGGALSSPILGYQRCLLYQDSRGNLFNLVLAKHASGPSEKWLDFLHSYSGVQAMMALVILCRSFPCVIHENEVVNLGPLGPAYLSLILGLVLSEEISLSWLNTSMFVRATPSVSGHGIISSPLLGETHDVIKKLILLSLTLAGAAIPGSIAQRVLILLGLSLACVALLVNAGARAWHFLKWQPLPYRGPGAGIMSYGMALLAGLVVPYMGHRSTEAGGNAVMEHIIKCSLMVLVAFVISDVDPVQEFVVVGSEECNQDYVNMAVGGWWCATLIVSLVLALKIPKHKLKEPPPDGEHVLVHDQTSPVGYRVPSLPDFEIDPTLAQTGMCGGCLPIQMEFAVGIFLALTLGAAVVFLGFTDWDNQVYGTVAEQLDKVF